MRAALYTAVNEPLAIEDVTLADPGPRDVLVRIAASGVCHSDLSAQTGGTPIPPPAILGHEGAGTVEWVGAEVSRVKVGDRVVASFTPACGSCFWCLHGQSNLCAGLFESSIATHAHRHDGTPLMGFSGLGTFTEVLLASEHSLVKVETDLPDEQLALIGCGVTTGVGAALNTAKVEPGSTVAVIGCGGVGQSVIQGARVAGAARIFAIDPVAMKREAAASLGATDLIDPADGDPIQQVMAATGGIGADYAFEVIGLPETILQAYMTARRGGDVIVVGMPRMEAQVTFPGFNLFFDEKRIHGCVYGSAQVRRDFPRFISLVEQGRLDLGSMVSRTIALDEVNDAFEAMKSGEVIRSVITKL